VEVVGNWREATASLQVVSSRSSIHPKNRDSHTRSLACSLATTAAQLKPKGHPPPFQSSFLSLPRISSKGVDLTGRVGSSASKSNLGSEWRWLGSSFHYGISRGTSVHLSIHYHQPLWRDVEGLGERYLALEEKIDAVHLPHCLKCSSIDFAIADRVDLDCVDDVDWTYCWLWLW